MLVEADGVLEAGPMGAEHLRRHWTMLSARAREPCFEMTSLDTAVRASRFLVIVEWLEKLSCVLDS